MNCTESAPRIISWNITLRCPLKCSHGYADAGEQERAGVLSTDEVCGVIDQIQVTGKPVVVLSGGEPLLCGDIGEIARYGKAGTAPEPGWQIPMHRETCFPASSPAHRNSLQVMSGSSHSAGYGPNLRIPFPSASGTCRHRDLCRGGGRVRAHAADGDFYAEDPFWYPDEKP